MLRNKFVLKYVKGKEVLDLGFLGENKDVDFSPLHQMLLNNSKKVTGVDIHKKRIDDLKKKGYNVICDNVLKLDEVRKLNKKYDCIIAGELIEHLENPAIFLEMLKPLLKKNGKIIITTPNIYSLRFIFRHLLFNQESPYWKNRKEEIKYGHVIGFSKMLLENFLLRNNFKIIDFSYVIKDEYSGFKGNLEKLISKLFSRVSPQLAYVIEVNK